MTTSISNTHVRFPRYTRRDADVSLALTPRDLSILQEVESFRLLTSEHIQALTPGSNQAILRRLHKLFHAGYLDRLAPRFVQNGGSAKMIYAITNKGAATLQKEGLLKEVSTTDRNAANRNLHDFSVHHRLLISHIRAMFVLACQGNAFRQNTFHVSTSNATISQHCQLTPSPGPRGSANNIQLLFWREGREIQDTIEVALPDKYAQFPVAPDAFFSLQDAQGRHAHFFSEADRGTMTVKRFTRKLVAYAAYWKAKRHTEKFKIKHFRVLTVTSSALRCKNLTRAAAAAPHVRERARLFLFTSEDKLTLQDPASVFDKIWTMPGSEAPCSILG